MSVRMMAEVWQLKLDTPAKIVLLKLADCADDDGRNAYPSVGRIARECGMSERSAQRALSRLRLWELVTIDRPATAMRPTTYALHPSKGVSLTPNRGDNLTPLTRARGVTTTPPEGCQSVTGGVTKSTRRGDAVTPEPSLIHQRKRPKNRQVHPPNPPQAGGTVERAERAKRGSKRKRDLIALDQTEPDRYFRGKFGQVLKERIARETA